MKRVMFLALLVTGCIVGLHITGCKEGEGDRCQLNSDCVEGLECNVVKKTCQHMGGGVADAQPAPDAPPIDAPPDV